MTPSDLPGCPQEAAVLAAVRTGCWSPGVREHLRGCAECGDAVLIAEFLTAEHSEAPPPAGLVWWKSELRRKRETTERALQPIRWAERVALCGGLAGVAAVVALLADTSPFLALTALGGLAALGLTCGAIWWVVSPSSR